MGFQEMIPLIKDGDPVSAAVTNAPDRALDGNVRYLRDLLEAIGASSALYARSVTVEAAALVGMPVYWNAAAARFDRGLARVEAQPASGVLVTAESSRVWGVVSAKHNGTLADVVLSGYAAVDIAAAVGGPAPAGTYYLSGTTPGGLVAQKPPVSVPVLRADGLGGVFVTPQVVDFLDRHVHCKFPLTCLPAGSVTPPEFGDRHVIAAPDASLPGWLPAGHPSFAGRAPLGAAFGYNLAAEPDLLDLWPPLPVDNASLEWDRGTGPELGATSVPLGPGGLAILDRNGIWWRSDCYGDVPWPVDTDTATSESALSISVLECPRALEMRLTLWFTRLNFAADVAVVTSLRSASPRLLVHCVGGAPGSTGDLELDLDLGLVVGDGRRGYLAVKDLADNTLLRGPVCEGIYALSPEVTLTGPASSPVDPADPSGPAMYHGAVGIAVAPAQLLELPIELIRLDRAEPETYQDTTYVAFRAAQASAIRCKLVVPAATALASLVLRFRILGRALGTLPALTVTARRLPRPPAGGAVPLPLAAAEFAVTIDTAATLALGNQYVEASAAPFAVAAGDVVFFTVSRSAGDGYPATVGLIQMAGVLGS